MASVRRICSSLSRRHFSSVTGRPNPRIGLVKDRKTQGVETTRSKGTAPNARVPPPTTPPSETVEITPEIQRNNTLLAVALLCFCGSVTWYSLKVVGQSGSLDGSNEDPLAALKQEAEAAQEKKLRESQQMADAQEMIKQVQSGAYDPDKYEEEEEEELMNRRRKKPWWKFW